LPTVDAILGITMAQILISGKDWNARALLRAQLIEEGFDVEAFENAQEVVRLLWTSQTMPSLLIADVFESEAPAADAVLLASWAKLVPIWILAGHSSSGPATPEGQGFERVLSRPLDVGRLVQEIKVRLAD
jgi:DNA-binding NtrC family response regulator